MSNLLEQAIIDATALREVAMKNAETALIEKYSKEFKESVQKLLEQDAGGAAPEVSTAPAADAAGSLNLDTGLGGSTDAADEEAFNDVSSSFLDGDEDEVVVIDFDQLKKQIGDMVGGKSPMLSTPDMMEPSSEELPAETPEQPVEMNEGLEEMYDQGANSSFNLDVLDEEQWEVEEDVLLNPVERAKKVAAGLPAQESDESDQPEEEFEQLELEEDAAAQAQAELDVGKAQQKLATIKSQDTKEVEKQAEEERKKKMSALASGESVQTESMEDIQITEEELKEIAEQIAEELKVDIDVGNLSDGHMGTTQKEKREQRNLEFAAARDEEEVEKRKEEESTMADLKKQLEEAIEVGAGLLEENEELIEKTAFLEQTLEELRENIEKLSVSNAKLLYINKTLGNVSLNERQKDQIVENISKSTSVLEAKTIYNTLQSTVSAVSSKKPKESLSEALIRGNSAFITRKKEVNDAPFAERMKKLAGIT
jgi:hypothetical protein